jgi:hypothetical protein
MCLHGLIRRKWRILGQNPSLPRRTSVLVVPAPDAFESGSTVSVLATDDNVVVRRTGPSGEAIRTDDWGAGETAVDEKPGGIIKWSIRGVPKQGEDDTLLVARTLIRRLNEEGANWSAPERVTGDSDVDCVARDGDATLEIQVKRIDEEDFWRRLARLGLAPGEDTPHQIACTLCRRIAATARRYPPSRRGSVTLALNARQTPQYATEAVAQTFRERYGEWARGLGFAGIWVVGPSPELSYRLDS